MIIMRRSEKPLGRNVGVEVEELNLAPRYGDGETLGMWDVGRAAALMCRVSYWGFLFFLAT